MHTVVVRIELHKRADEDRIDPQAYNDLHDIMESILFTRKIYNMSNGEEFKLPTAEYIRHMTNLTTSKNQIEPALNNLNRGFSILYVAGQVDYYGLEEA